MEFASQYVTLVDHYGISVSKSQNQVPVIAYKHISVDINIAILEAGCVHDLIDKKSTIIEDDVTSMATLRKSMENSRGIIRSIETRRDNTGLPRCNWMWWRWLLVTDDLGSIACELQNGNHTSDEGEGTHLHQFDSALEVEV